MFRLDNLLEQWAHVYAPLHHPLEASAKPKERSFFRIDALDAENEWSRNADLIQHPVVCFSTRIDAEIDRQKPKFVSRAWGIYLMTPQISVNPAQKTGLEATDCKMLLDDMAIDLIGFLYDLQTVCGGGSWPKGTPESVQAIATSLDDLERRQVRGLRLDQTRWWTAPRSFGRWWILGFEIEGLDPRMLCIRPQMYIEG